MLTSISNDTSTLNRVGTVVVYMNTGTILNKTINHLYFLGSYLCPVILMHTHTHTHTNISNFEPFASCQNNHSRRCCHQACIIVDVYYTYMNTDASVNVRVGRFAISSDNDIPAPKWSILWSYNVFPYIHFE